MRAAPARRAGLTALPAPVTEIGIIEAGAGVAVIGEDGAPMALARGVESLRGLRGAMRRAALTVLSRRRLGVRKGAGGDARAPGKSAPSARGGRGLLAGVCRERPPPP